MTSGASQYDCFRLLIVKKLCSIVAMDTVTSIHVHTDSDTDIPRKQKGVNK